MKLLRLVLSGFKSFADKTTIEFADGMTVIVGPNGCGKSNISDAVRWVLGEQNVRNLRGQKAEDVIFAGSEHRKPKNAASVTLVLDNSDHELPIDTAEVAIGRRVYRNGDSEFSINKRGCRLKDIHELLANTGLGKGSMAIIGQNRVDQILSARPEERRVIFEEVAGISKFRIRKTDGLRKLEKASANTERVLDLKALLEEQMEPLKKEAEKAEKLQKLSEEKKAFLATASLLKLSSSRRMIARYENEAAGLHDEEAAGRTLLSKISVEKEQLERDVEAHQEKMSKRAKEVADRQALSEKLRGDYRVKVESLRHAKEEWERLLADDEDEKEAVEEMKEDLLSVKEELTEKEEALKESKVKLQNREKEKKDAEEKLAKSRELYAAKVKESQQKISEKERLTQELSHRKEDKLRLSSVLDKSEGQKKEAEEKLHISEDSLKTLLEKEKANEETMKDMAECGKADAARSKAAEQEQYRLMRLQSETESKEREIQTRRTVLERQDREYASFSRTTKTIMEASEPWTNHVLGPLGELVHVPSEYTEAAEVAMGGMISHIVTDTSKAAQEIIVWLKGRHAGRTTFYPLDSMKPRYNNDMIHKAEREEGIRGTAAVLFAHDSRIDDLMEVLLGRVLIADNLDVARRTAKKYGYRFRIVTMDGQVVNAGGSMTGGSMRKKENTYFGRKEEIEKLYKDEEIVKKRIAEIREKRKAQDELCAVLQEKVTKERESWQACSVEAAAFRERRESIEREIASQKGALREYEKECEESERDILMADEKIKEIEESLASLSDIASPGEDTESESLKKILDEVSEALTREYVSYAQLEGELAASKKEMEKISDSLEESHRNIERRKTLMANKKQKMENTEKSIHDLEGAYKKAEETFRALEKDRADMDEMANAFHMRRMELDKKWQAAQTEAAKVTGKSAELKARIESFRHDENAEEEKLLAFGYTEKSAEAVRRKGSMPEIQKAIASVDAKISELGAVNPNGVREYEDHKERLEFYNTQLTDLKKAEEGLKKVVSGIDDAMTKQFTEAFGKINKEFGRVIGIMFHGGNARLELTDKEKPLEGGIEIFLELPGKKTQSLTLMSGGERALTVSALLISFMAYKPAPFCFLDEIDAALDDANVERYSRMIKDYKDKTQFIIISHRKKTMEFADTLQGVTMAEKGVSSLITVHVEDYVK